jgi:DNA polymerase-3 subunit delta'
MVEAADDDSPFPPPRATADLVGQDAAEALLVKALAGGRLHHGWIFGGPSGIGKETLAYRFARRLLAGGGFEAPGLSMPESHPVFRRIAAEGHADLRAISLPRDKKGEEKSILPVDEIRKIPPFLRLTSAEGGWRVAIVDSAEKMNLAAQNALLKILEEPPERAVLILICDRPGRLLPTIRSRCRSLTLEPLSDSDAARLLVRHAPDTSPEERALLLRLAEGSIGRALRLWHEGGLELYRDLEAVLTRLPRLDSAATQDFAEKAGGWGKERRFAQTAELLTWWLRRMARISATGGGAEDKTEARLAALRPARSWLSAFDDVSRILNDAERASLDRAAALTAAFARLGG